MSELETVLEDLRVHEGVEHLLLLGRDGLLIHHSGGDGVDTETVAALAPGLASAGAALGDAAGRGEFSTAVLEWEAGVGVLASVSSDTLLAILLHPGVGFAPLLRSIRERRADIAAIAG
ncbi:MAG: roadblock/LC7 domain-containing protein [Gemmatimonadetes bacterium]|nr:roadblock/LC7 domain-containing protein [Gemmatimonadota bacterium]